MDKLSGKAQRVQHGWAGGGDNGTVWASTDFNLRETAVHIDTHSRAQIQEGDEVRVAGQLRGKRLRALAWQNLTHGSKGDTGYLATTAIDWVAIALAVVGVALGSWLFLLILLFGIVVIRQANQTKEAIAALEGDA